MTAGRSLLSEEMSEGRSLVRSEAIGPRSLVREPIREEKVAVGSLMVGSVIVGSATVMVGSDVGSEMKVSEMSTLMVSGGGAGYHVPSGVSPSPVPSS